METKDNLEQIIYKLEKIDATISVLGTMIFYSKQNYDPDLIQQTLLLLNDSMQSNINVLKELWKQIN